MEIRQLRYFRVIAEAGSFARGANNLRVAQPALSRSIAKLEEELGQSLFVRQNTGVALTQAGEKLYEQAIEILTKVRDITDGLAEGSVPSGIVRLGAPQTVHAQLLVPIAVNYLNQYSRCELDLVQDSGLRLREMVSNGALDMAIVPSVIDGSLHCTPLVRESICLVLPAGARSKFGATAALDEITGVPLILTGYPGSMRLSIDRQFPQLHTELNVRSEVNSASLLIDLVVEGVGYGLAPCSIIARHGDRLDYVPIQGLTVSWSLVASYSRLRLPAVQKLEEAIIAYVQKVAASSEWPTATLI